MVKLTKDGKVDKRVANGQELIRQFSIHNNEESRLKGIATRLHNKGKTKLLSVHLDTVLQNFMYQEISVIDEHGKPIIMTALEHVVAVLLKKAIHDENLDAISKVLKELRGGADQLHITNNPNTDTVSVEAEEILREAGIIFVDTPKITDVDAEDLDDTDLFD